MKIMIIGGAGYIGSNIALKLHDEGHSVISVSRSKLPDVPYTQVTMDLFGLGFEKVFAQFDTEIVIQCAWITSQPIYLQSLANWTYSQRTIELFQIASQAGVKHFIGLGSAAEFGYRIGLCDSRISIPMPSTPYGKAKLQTAEVLLMLSQETEMLFTWARIFQVYGCGQSDDRFLPSILRAINENVKLKVKNPELTHDWISTDDIAFAISWILQNKLHGLLDVGTSIGTSNFEIVSAFEKEYNRNIFLEVGTGQNDLHEKYLVVSQNSPLLASGWKPRKNIQLEISNREQF